jgi:hypothetical protein
MAILIGSFTGVVYFVIKSLTTNKETNVPILLGASTIVGGLAGAIVGLLS